jgi:predicted cupin superfamily sugar epimerase
MNLIDTKHLTVENLVEKFHLLPHPEGGYYAETFRSDFPVLVDDPLNRRMASTAIYFLLCPGKV